MQNFEYYTPTRVLFGRGTQQKVGEIIKEYGYKKVLLHYGGGSIKRSGLYDTVTASLRESGIDFIELGGVEPNPKLSLVRKGAQLCKDEGIELVLAVGGGSVMDSAKEIAIGALDDGDQWDFSIKKRVPEKALPVGVVLTISASGSEMSSSAVITNEEQQLKRGYNSPLHRPLFALCNPELTYTVSKYQTGCGIVDICMHTLERYFSASPAAALTDRFALALVRSTVEAGAVAIENPRDYDARATLMWASSLSHCDLTGAGRDTFMAPCHQIEHELSGMYDRVAHGAGLAVIFPAWAKYLYKAAPERFAQYAKDVFDVPYDGTNAEAAALEGIARTEQYFQQIGMPIRLSELGVGTEGFDEMADKCTFHGGRILPCYKELGKQEIMDILELCK